MTCFIHFILLDYACCEVSYPDHESCHPSAQIATTTTEAPQIKQTRPIQTKDTPLNNANVIYVKNTTVKVQPSTGEIEAITKKSPFFYITIVTCVVAVIGVAGVIILFVLFLRKGRPYNRTLQHDPISSGKCQPSRGQNYNMSDITVIVTIIHPTPRTVTSARSTAAGYF